MAFDRYITPILIRTAIFTQINLNTSETGVYMKYKSIYLYAKLSPERNEAVFSGIKFADFIKYVPIQIQNILLPKPLYIGERYVHCFELLEGIDNITRLNFQNIYNYGNFCFLDYKDPSTINLITDEQIAELLYLAHMFKPLISPFFDILQNNYVYLSHDDGWYCKIYCREIDALNSILFNKLTNCINRISCNRILFLPNILIEKITELSSRGLLIELNMSMKKNKTVSIMLYEVGEHESMDYLINNLGNLYSKPLYNIRLVCGQWEIS